MKNVKNASRFLELLVLLFVALKLTGQITWAWIYVLSPFWIPAAIWFTFYALALFLKKLGK